MTENTLKKKYELHKKRKIMKVENLITISLMAVSFFVFVTPMQYANAQVISFDIGPPAEYTLNDFAVITVDDSGNAVFTDIGSGIQTIFVTITSSLESKTIPLTETSATSGVFQNTALIFTEGDDEFTVGSTITITQEETVGLTPAEDTITVDVASTDPITLIDTSAIPGFVLTETGATTGIFTGTLGFTTGPTSGNIIQVADGDRISINYLGEFAYGLISPNPNDGVRTLNAANCVPPAVICDTITVSYPGALDVTADIILGGGGGGGGGGLIRPGLVLDVLVGGGGGGGGDRSPPSFTLNKLSLSNLSLPEIIMNIILQANPFEPMMAINNPSFDIPLILGDSGYALYGYSQTIETYTAETGTTLPIELTLSDSTGVEHISLYMNLRGTDREIQNSDTYIIYDEDKPLEIIDPHGLFSTVNFTESKVDSKYHALFNVTFAKPMDKSDIIIRVWDPLRNSADTKVFDAIQVVGEPLVDNSITTETATMFVPYYKTLRYVPIADTEGNVVYYNPFGDLEQKRIHPYHEPTIYPDNIARAERHDSGFEERIMGEVTKAQTLAQALIGNPFKESEKRLEHKTFFYSSTVGRLDRENTDTLTDAKMKEHIKATKYFTKYYHTNHTED